MGDITFMHLSFSQNILHTSSRFHVGLRMCTKHVWKRGICIQIITLHMYMSKNLLSLEKIIVIHVKIAPISINVLVKRHFCLNGKLSLLMFNVYYFHWNLMYYFM